MEPKNRDSLEWKDWFVRHQFGPMVAMSIKSADAKDLDILVDFVKTVQKEKKA